MKILGLNSPEIFLLLVITLSILGPKRIEKGWSLFQRLIKFLFSHEDDFSKVELNLAPHSEEKPEVNEFKAEVSEEKSEVNEVKAEVSEEKLEVSEIKEISKGKINKKVPRNKSKKV